MKFTEENGSALVVVLIFSTILLICSTWAVSNYRKGVVATEMLMDKLSARVSAESSLQLLQFYGATGRATSSHIINNLPDVAGIVSAIPLDGKPVKMKIEGNDVFIRIRDSGGLLNVVYFSPGVFKRLLVELGASQLQAETIKSSYADWLDSNSFHHLNGAEESFYKYEKRCSYSPRNAPVIQSIWELSLLKGMTSELWEKFQPYLIHSPKDGFNVNAMSKEMLSAYYSLDSEMVANLLQLKKNKGYITLTDVREVSGKTVYDISGRSGDFPMRLFRIAISVHKGVSLEKWQGDINFVADRYGPYRILDWVEGESDSKVN